MAETSNKRTIDSYNTHSQEYIDGTVHEVSGYVKEWLDKTFAGVPKDARILEFGSAFGRDARYLQGKGYGVTCTDATPAFVDLLQRDGFGAYLLNAIEDPMPDEIDVVLANAVLLHFTREEAARVLVKIHAALSGGGTFAFTLKQGEGEGWSEEKLGAPRFFAYWTKEQIEQELQRAGFNDVTVWGDRPTGNATWLQIIARKAQVDE